MSKRNLIFGAFFAGMVFGIAGLTWISNSASSSANAVPAPEVKPAADSIEVREYGQDRNTNVNNGVGIGVRAYREQTAQQPAFYGVELDGDDQGDEVQISLEDAEKLLAFFKKYKDKTKSKAKQIERAYVKFSAKALKGEKKLEIDYNLKIQQFSIIEPPYQCDATFFDDVEAAINDAKAMKKIPFSVTP